MNIGIMQTAYKKAADYGAFYNVQELGLARAFADMGHNVTLIKAVDAPSLSDVRMPDKRNEASYEAMGSKAGKAPDGENTAGGENAVGGENTAEENILVRTECGGRLKIMLVGVKYMGINGLISTKVLPEKMDALIYFSDTQICLPKVYRWCLANKVAFYPYIGVIESHSENAVKRALMSVIRNRNLTVYRKTTVFSKTQDITAKLKALGCQNVNLVAVGLDETVMYNNNVKAQDDKEPNDKTEAGVRRLLFIGRMEEEKHPFEMIRIYDSLLDNNPDLELKMIGDGYMFEESGKRLNSVIEAHKLKEGQAELIRKVPYSRMHEYYEWTDIYVNLNTVEILGMSILEAMYYSCPVLAVDAPGPRYILDKDNNKDISGLTGNRESGIIADDFDRVKEILENLTGSREDKCKEEQREFRDEGVYSLKPENKYRACDLTQICANAEKVVRQRFVWSKIAGKILKIMNSEKR